MTKINVKQCTESGIVLALVLIAIGLYSRNVVYFKLSFLALILSLTVPVLFKPLAYGWFELAHYMGKVSSIVILSIIYIIILLPVGLIIRLFGKDSLALNKFKKGTQSVFTSRDHVFTADDILKPY